MIDFTDYFRRSEYLWLIDIYFTTHSPFTLIETQIDIVDILNYMLQEPHIEIHVITVYAQKKDDENNHGAYMMSLLAHEGIKRITREQLKRRNTSSNCISVLLV